MSQEVYDDWIFFLVYLSVSLEVDNCLCFFICLDFIWWNISSSNFLRKDMWKEHLFEISHVWKCIYIILAHNQWFAWVAGCRILGLKITFIQTFNGITPLASSCQCCCWEVQCYSFPQSFGMIFFSLSLKRFFPSIIVLVSNFHIGGSPQISSDLCLSICNLNEIL